MQEIKKFIKELLFLIGIVVAWDLTVLIISVILT